MISMEMLGKIRRMYFRDKLSLHQIAKRTGLSRNTIRKWVRAPEAIQPAYQRCATFNKLSPFHETLEQALKADSFRPKHNRRSAKALFELIKAEGYDGGYSQLTSFVRSWRGEQGKSLRAFVPLTFALGEAFQFDWSEESLLIGGLFRRIQFSHVKLCASRAFWFVAYPSQGHEMLFDARTGHGVIMDVEPTPAHRTEEVESTKTMIDRVEAQFDIKPERLIGDTAYPRMCSIVQLNLILDGIADKVHTDPPVSNAIHRTSADEKSRLRARLRVDSSAVQENRHDVRATRDKENSHTLFSSGHSSSGHAIPTATHVIKT